MTGTLLCVVLALVLDLLLAGLGRLLTPWLRAAAEAPLVNRSQQAVVWLNDPLNWTNPGGILDRLGEHL